MEAQAQSVAICVALLVIVVGVTLRDSGRYQEWTHQHPRRAAGVMGLLAAAFTNAIWLGVLGVVPSLGVGVAAAVAAAFGPYRRLST